MTSSLDDMYREVILDHYRSPRGRKPLCKANVLCDGMNPSCGDEITLTAQVSGDVVEDVHVNCQGCAISVASASMLAEAIKGRPLNEVRQIAQAVRKLLKGEEDIDLPEELEDTPTLAVIFLISGNSEAVFSSCLTIASVVSSLVPTGALIFITIASGSDSPKRLTP